MKYEVHNFGPTRRFPYKEDILIVNNETRIIEDAELAKHLAAFPLVSVKELKESIPAPATLVNKRKRGRPRKLQGDLK